MVTAGSVIPKTQEPSQGAGQTRPVNSGKLFVVATPIGNLEDISIRAIDTLKNSDIIIAEDTRITVRLLGRYKIKNKLTSYHINNERYKTDQIINYLKEGKNIAFVSDAGTPCISDPGYILVNEARKNDINIYFSLFPHEIYSN